LVIEQKTKQNEKETLEIRKCTKNKTTVMPLINKLEIARVRVMKTQGKDKDRR
jgi:hypothetical protein